MPIPGRILLFVAALCALVIGLFGGLIRFGFALPMAAQTGNHGAFMICGLFGTLIGLERAVAMGKPWSYVAPVFSAAGVVAMLFVFEAASVLFIIAAAVLSTACLTLWMKQRVLHLATLALASLMWLIGNLIWLVQGSIAAAVPAWLCFLILTIAAERLELSRFLPTPESARRIFIGLLVLIIVGVAPAFEAAFALGLIGLACWLLRYDIVRHTLRQSGLPRYIAVCLALGYVWLGLGGLLMLVTDSRDAALHALLLGFVFSMVFGHAPIILPAVARLRLPYHPALYLPLAMLHASLAVRVAAALLEELALRRHAAVGNALALAFFAATVATLLWRSRKA